MNPIPISWCLGGAGAAALLGGLAGWTVRDWKRDSEVLEGLQKASELVDKQRSVIDSAAEAYEKDRVDAGAGTTVREATIREIYRDAPADMRCDPPADVHRVLNDAISAANARAAGQPATGLPAAAASSGPAD